MAKLVRVLTYEGTEAFIEASLAKIGVPLNGKFQTAKGSISSIITEVRACPCLTCNYNITSNFDLICDDCKASAKAVGAIAAEFLTTEEN
jgi:hypothetical protein